MILWKGFVHTQCNIAKNNGFLRKIIVIFKYSLYLLDNLSHHYRFFQIVKWLLCLFECLTKVRGSPLQSLEITELYSHSFFTKIVKATFFPKKLQLNWFLIYIHFDLTLLLEWVLFHCFSYNRYKTELSVCNYHRYLVCIKNEGNIYIHQVNWLAFAASLCK